MLLFYTDYVRDGKIDLNFIDKFVSQVDPRYILSIL